MNVLVLHRNFPGQFRHIVRHLAKAGHRVVGVGNMQAPGLPGVTLAHYARRSCPSAASGICRRS